MKEFLKKNLVLVLAFGLPIALIAVVAVSVYLPSLFLSTNYNFIYATCGDSSGNYYPYGCQNFLHRHYSVVGGKLVVNPIDKTSDLNRDKVPDSRGHTDRIFFHDTAKNESREITIEEAQAMQLNGLLSSPDGVTVSEQSEYRSGGFFPFDNGASSYAQYLTKGKSRKKLNLINADDRYYYYDNFEFIGWVLPGRTGKN